jgi:hypothetical protein
MKIFWVLIAVAMRGSFAASIATAQTPLPSDLHRLIGKKVIVGRLALCTPKTYTTNLTYAGKPAELVSVTVTTVANISERALNQMTPTVRAMVEDQRNGGTVLFRFADGVELDTCVDQAYSQLVAGMELVPGETIAPIDVTPPAVPASTTNAVSSGPLPTALPAQDCPVMIVRLSSDQGGFRDTLGEALTTSEFQRQLDETTHGGESTHYLDSRLRNVSQKPIATVESVAVYTDRMGDQSTTVTLLTQNTKPIAPGKELQGNYMDREQRMANGTGQVLLYVHRIRFQDQSMWQDNGSHSCSFSSVVK